jgi:hypothetical protein
VLTKSISWATITLITLVAIAAIVGGAVVIWGPSGALSFQQYLDDLEKFAVAVGLLGIGRGVKAGLENHALFSSPLSESDILPPAALAPDQGEAVDSGVQHV